MFLDDLLTILAAFGGKGGTNEITVRFLLAAFFWGGLLCVALHSWWQRREWKDLYIAAAASVGMGREILMFGAWFGSMRGHIDFDALHPFLPPLEHAATLLSYVLIGFAFVTRLAPESRSSRWLLRVGCVLTGGLYAVTALSWPAFLGRHPRAAFGSFWGDIVFRIMAVSLLLVILVLLGRQRRKGMHVPAALFVACLFFFFDEFLMIHNLASGESLVAVYGLIRHNLHIWAIPLLLGVYWESTTRFLRESEARFRELADLLPQPVFEIDLQGTITFGNGHAFSIFGYAPDDLEQGLNALAMVVPEDRKRAVENLGRVLSGEKSRGEEYMVMRRDGTTFPVLIYSSPILRQGAPVGFRGIMIDNTERRQAEEHLRKLSTVVEQSPVAIVIADTAGTIEYVNPRYTRMTGYSREEATGKSLRMLNPGVIPNEDQRILWETVTVGREWQGEHQNQNKNGKIFWERVIVAPVKDATGAITHCVCLKEDITAAKEADEEKARLESQLRQAQKMEAIGQLAGGVAHDFNNLLTAIIGYGKLLEMTVVADDRGRHYLEQILLAADRAAQVTHGLLAFSRKQILSPSPTDLNGIVRNVEKLLARLIGEDIEFCSTLHDEELTVMVDPGQIDQVVINLATNARDAMPGGGRLSITTSRVELVEGSRQFEKFAACEQGNYAVLEVSDTGSGMDAETCARVFEPFFTTKEVGKGTGLGLAIVYGIIRQHNGCIHFDSTSGVGTTFSVFLPLIQTEVHHSPAEEERPAELNGSETVLLVEDNLLVRQLSRSILETFGYLVIEAEDGEAAVARFHEHRDEVQLVISDVVMPKKNGNEAFVEISRIRPGVKALFTSGYTADALHSRGILLDGINYLHKPVTPEVLLRKVREVLDG